MCGLGGPERSPPPGRPLFGEKRRCGVFLTPLAPLTTFVFTNLGTKSFVFNGLKKMIRGTNPS